ELLAPPIIRHLAHPDLADCVHYVLALRDQNIDLPQLRNDLFRLVSLPCHCSPPGCQRHTSSRTTSMGVDQGRDPRVVGVFGVVGLACDLKDRRAGSRSCPLEMSGDWDRLADQQEHATDLSRKNKPP